MSIVPINLTRLAVCEELDTLLDSYAYQHYQSEFSFSEVREALIEWVLSQIPNRCVAINIKEKDLIRNLLQCVSTPTRLKIEALLQQGIQVRVQQQCRWGGESLNLDRDSCRVPVVCGG